MILEVATLFVKIGKEKQFENDFKIASQYISSIQGYSGHSLRKCIEQENKYILLVDWEKLEDHTIGFRQSEQYLEWKKLLHHYYDPFPIVEHFEMTFENRKAKTNTLMIFKPSTIKDIDNIFEFYDLAVEYQKTKFNKQWQGFERVLVEKEITENRQWKITIDDEIACVFAITFEDKSIWKEKNIDKAVYFHRIVTHPKYRGQHFVEKIIEWGILFAKAKKLDFLRMDTWGDNESLIAYYQKCGFDFLGIITPDYDDLPKHYKGITLSLFQIKVQN